MVSRPSRAVNRWYGPVSRADGPDLCRSERVRKVFLTHWTGSHVADRWSARETVQSVRNIDQTDADLATRRIHVPGE